MTREKLIETCLTFGPDFAKTWAEEVISTQSLQTLWELIMERDTLNLSKDDLEKIEFRSAYILEAVYCRESILFSPYLTQFFDLFPTITNGSMRRHFAKICFLAIKKGSRPHNIDAIATACADWIIDPQTRVAVKAWALDILTEFATTEHWIQEMLSEIIASQTQNPSAGMTVRLRRIKATLNKMNKYTNIHSGRLYNSPKANDKCKYMGTYK